MAPFSNCISFLFLTTLLLPLQITARDSQFFSKVSHFNDNNNNNVKELPNKEGTEINKPEQQPVFIPETENSYGLYGTESNQVPSTTTTTTNAAPYTTTTTTAYKPYKPEFEDPSKYPNNKYYNNYAYNTRFAETGYNNNDKYYHKDSYGANQYEKSDTKEGYNQNTEKDYYNNNAANDRYNPNNNNYNANNNRYTYNSYNNNAANNRYNVEKQGMSDTRFLEGGRYYHDINNEKNHRTINGDSSRAVNTNNWYSNRGNNYGNYNGYQSQEEFEEEQNEFEP